jgi:hypothetical protein
MSKKRKKPSRDPRKDPQSAYQTAYKCGHCNGTLGDGPQGWAVYHEPGCPVLTGVVDGGTAGRRAAATASEVTGETVVHESWLKDAREQIRDIDPGGGPATPRAAAVIKRTVGQPGTLDKCPHLKPGEPAYMVAHRSGVILCTACWIAESQRMTGTREDVTCDYCRQYQPPPPAGGTRMRAIQSAPFTERGLIVVFGLCPPCWEADQAGIPI